MRTQLQVLGWIHVALRCLYVLGGGALLFLFSALGAGTAATAGREAVPLATALGVIGWVLGGYLLVLGLPGVVIGWGLAHQARWARIPGIILSCIDLPFFPIGTALGIHGLIVLFHPDTIAILDGREGIPAPIEA